MYETGNPVPSSALEDMVDNAQTFDALVTKTEGTTTDRLGRTRRVFQQIIMDMGFQPLSGSFQTGATLTQRNQVLQDKTTGVFYSWNGTLPKAVSAGSTPATSGGIGAGAWVDRTDLMLRGELQTGTGELIQYIPSGLSAIARSMRSKMGDVISIVDFGAVGDGVTDNYVAIQAAVNACLAYPHHALYVPAGSYYTSIGISVYGSIADRFTLFGDGRSSDIFSDAAGVTLDIMGVAGDTFQYAKFHDLCIRNINGSGVALQTRNTEGFHIYECVIAGNFVGLQMSINANESDIKPQIHNNVFSGGVYGIRGGDTRVADATIRDNIFIDSTGTMMEFGYLDGGTINGNKFFSNKAGTNAVVGMRLKKPIYTVCSDNDFFGLGGSGVIISSPRYSRFENNRLINCGQNAAAAAMLIGEFPAVAGTDFQITGNTFKNCNGNGITATTASSILSRYKISENYFENVGDSGIYNDAIALTNCTDFEVRKNTVIGNSVTRYWLNVSGSTAVIDDNIHTGCINPDIYRAGTNTLKIPMGQRFLTNVTTTQTLTFDDDGVIGGPIVGASITINLPSAQSCPGKRYMIAKTDASIYSLIIDPASTQTIDGAATLNVNTQYQTVSIISDGISGWVTTSSN